MRISCPPGMAKPPGSRSWGFRDVEVDSFTAAPNPATFWTEYHAKRRPFIVKGAVLDSPAMSWTDEWLGSEDMGELVSIACFKQIATYMGWLKRAESCLKQRTPWPVRIEGLAEVHHGTLR